MNKIDWFQVGFPLAMISQCSPLTWCEKWQKSPIYRYPQNEVETAAKGHTVGFSKQARGDLVLTLTLAHSTRLFGENEILSNQDNHKTVYCSQTVNESLISMCKDFL